MTQKSSSLLPIPTLIVLDKYFMFKTEHPRLKFSVVAKPQDDPSWFPPLDFYALVPLSTLVRADLCNQKNIVEMMKSAFWGLVIKDIVASFLLSLDYLL